MSRTTLLLYAAAVALAAQEIWAHSDGGSWDYKNVEAWGGLCGRGAMQSPVDVDTDSLETDVAEPLILINYDKGEPTSFKSGAKSIEVNVPAHCLIGMTGGGLRGLYILHHIHFHINSEHTVDDKRMPMEAHFVHYNIEYGNLTEAAHHPKGLAVLAVLFRKYDEENPSNIYSLLNGLQRQLTDTPVMNPGRFLPKNLAMFYRYEGSLTTPPCSEVVIWTVLKYTLPVSPKQIQELKGFLAPGTVNYRPTQDLNGRVVKLISTMASSHKTLPNTALFFIPLLFSLKYAN